MKYALNNVLVLDSGSEFHKKKMNVLIEDGIISQITVKDIKGDQSFEGEGLCLSKGWKDLRVHLKDPGYEHQEKFEYLMESAARGGFTSILTLPNSNPPVAHKDILKSVITSSKDYAVSILPSAVLTKNSEGEEIAELIDLHHAGAVAFTDGDHEIKNSELFAHALLYLKKFNGLILVHAEDSEISQNGQMNEGENSTILGLKGIPNIAESARVQRDLELLEHFGGRIHFSHISTPKSLDLIKKAKKKGLKVSCDISVHHMILDDSMLMEYDSNYKLLPPLRSKKEIDVFWKALKDDTIDAIVSDHNAKDEESKNLEFDLTDFGIIGLETLFPSIVKEAEIQIGIDKLISKLTDGPDKVLEITRPAINKGENADLTLFALNTKWQYNPKTGGARPKNSPFLGQTFSARVLAIFNKGKVFVNT